MLCGSAIVWPVAGRRPALFLRAFVGSTGLAYIVAGGFAFQTEREYVRLRNRYPYESMEGRLPATRPTSPELALPAPTQRLARLEAEVSHGVGNYREFQLQQLHEHAIDLFINSPGFGVARMMTPSEWSLASGLRREPVPLPPCSPTPRVWSPGDGEQPPSGVESPLGGILEASILDFVNPRGFGYIKDRRHVAGFETHRFSQVPRRGPGRCGHWNW